jgi:hypothetical protein
MGIEPTLPAWKAGALPLCYTRKYKRELSLICIKQIVENPIFSIYFHLLGGANVVFGRELYKHCLRVSTKNPHFFKILKMT